MRFAGLWGFVCAGLMLGALPASAQFGGMGAGMGGGMGSMRGGGLGGPGGAPRDGGERRGQAAAPTPPRLQPDAWPRLDPGAVICRSLDSLRQRAAMAANPAMEGRPPTDCRMILRMVPVTVLERAGPGATQVQIGAPAPEKGWTDAWLPDRASGTPPGPRPSR